MKIENKRTEARAEAISGTLTITCQYICDTAENRLTALPPYRQASIASSVTTASSTTASCLS